MNAHEAFAQQSFRSLWFRLIDIVLRRCSDLLDFNQILRDASLIGQRDRGMQVVPVSRIVGTVGRSADFDRAFRPRRKSLRWRWMRVQALYEQGGSFPAVELYKIGNDYFVSDGHHRVSVARANRVAYIDAHVIEIDMGRPAYTRAQPLPA